MDLEDWEIRVLRKDRKNAIDEASFAVAEKNGGLGFRGGVTRGKVFTRVIFFPKNIQKIPPIKE